MKFCKDCKHYEPFEVEGYPSLAHCWKNPNVNLVTGEKSSKTASLERRVADSKDYCGPEAKFFEPIVENSPEPVDNTPEVSNNLTFIEQIVKFFKRS